MLTGKEEGSKCRQGRNSVRGTALWAGWTDSGKALHKRLGIGSEAVDLDVDVLLAPDEGDSRQPVLALEGFARARPVFSRQDPSRGHEIRPGDFASDGARSDLHQGIVPHALVFPGVAASHHVKLVVLFSKPDRGTYRGAVLANCGEADVFLALDFARDGHKDIVSERWRADVPCNGALTGLVHL